MPGRQAPKDMVAADRDSDSSQNEPEAAREEPGCERGLMTRWQGRLADRDQKVASQGLGRASGAGARSRQGTSPGKVETAQRARKVCS